MPTFFSKSGSFKALTVTGSSLTVASSSIFFRNLSTSPQSNVVTYNATTGQLFYTASSAIGGGGGGSTAPGGLDTYIQFNSGSVFGGIADFSFNYVNQLLSLNGSFQHGFFTNASNGTGAHAEGYLTTAQNNYAHAEGKSTLADGDYAHAEGEGTQALAIGSHSEGYSTSAEGRWSHTEGDGTTTKGDYSHAAGANTTALGVSSYAGGYFTVASGSYQTVVGQFNEQGDESSLFIVGNGEGSLSRKDAFKVTNNSSIIVATQSAAPGWLGKEGEIVPVQNGSNYFIYVYIGGAWRSSSLF